MNREAMQVIANAVLNCQQGVLFVDEKDLPNWGPNVQNKLVALHQLNLAPDEIWYLANGEETLSLVIVSQPRSPKELYQVIEGAERLVAVGGSILIAPYPTTTEYPVENRYEATEIFIAIHRDRWSRTMLAGNVIALQRIEPSKLSREWLDKTAAESANVVEPAIIAAQPPAVESSRDSKKKVISLAVFGTGGYWNYLPAFVRAHHTLFPGYELRIHHDDNIFTMPYGAALIELSARDLVKLKRMEARPTMGKTEGMLWRLAPAWDLDVDYVFSRDLDALPTWKERCVTEEFIAAAETGIVNAHTIHSNSAHAGIMGGLCGFKSSALRAIATSFPSFIALAGYTDEEFAEHGRDQNFLNSKKVAAKLKLFEHSIFEAFLESGQRIIRQPTDWGDGNHSVRFCTDIATFDDERVPETVRVGADTLIPYMGVAGYDIQRALDFYNSNERCPLLSAIREAEEAAGNGYTIHAS